MQPCFEGSLEDPLLRLGIVERRKVSALTHCGLCVQAPVCSNGRSWSCPARAERNLANLNNQESLLLSLARDRDDVLHHTRDDARWVLWLCAALHHQRMLSHLGPCCVPLIQHLLPPGTRRACTASKHIGLLLLVYVVTCRTQVQGARDRRSQHACALALARPLVLTSACRTRGTRTPSPRRSRV